MVLATHIILCGYGHRLPNDPRGSSSRQVHSPRLAALGPVRVAPREPPPPAEVAAFQEKAHEQLHFPVMQWGPSARQALADAVGEVVEDLEFTCHACAFLASHMHLLIRRHDIRGQDMPPLFWTAGRARLIELGMAPDDHPVFSANAGHYFKSTAELVWDCVGYIHDNYVKHEIEPALAPWVVPYDGWSGKS